MPTPRRLAGTATRVPTQTRARYVRSSGDILMNDPDGWTSDGLHGPIWWVGYDGGGGATPIGPNGPNDVAMLPAVTRLTAIITDPLSAVPWKHVEQGFGGAILTTPRWITDPMLTRPDSRWDAPALPCVLRLPRSTFWASWIRIACHYGQAALVFIQDESGQPKAGSLRTIHPWYLNPVDQDGVLVWEVGYGNSAVRFDRDGYLQDGPVTWQIAVLRDPHAPVDEEGRSVSVFERHADTFGTAAQIESYTRGSFANDGVPSGFLKVLTPGLTQPQADELKAAWMAAHGGYGGRYGGSRSVAILNSSTDYTPIARSPLEQGLVENKRASLADLCMAFSLDPNGALGISMGNSGVYMNAQAWMSRIKTDLLSWIEAVEQTVSSLLPAGRGMQMDFSELTRPDPKEHYEALKVAIDAGILTRDEARNTLGLPALPEDEPVPEQPPPPSVPAPEPEPPAERHAIKPWRRS